MYISLNKCQIARFLQCKCQIATEQKHGQAHVNPEITLHSHVQH